MKKRKTSFFRRLYFDIINLLFPIVCAGCGRKLFFRHEVLCITCETSLPKTNYHRMPWNPIEKKLFGRCNIARASALYFSEKNTIVRSLLYNLKYKRNEMLGKHLGLLFARELKDSLFAQYDLIIPVPLHPSKQRMRGFNQCQPFAEGLSEGLGIQINNYSVYRKIANPSQTHLNRAERWDNVAGIFDVHENENFRDRKILLIDDVITTGSTLEACAAAIDKCCPKEISILTIAVASS